LRGQRRRSDDRGREQPLDRGEQLGWRHGLHQVLRAQIARFGLQDFVGNPVTMIVGVGRGLTWSNCSPLKPSSRRSAISRSGVSCSSARRPAPEIGRDDRVVAGLPQQLLQPHARGPVVFDDQDLRWHVSPAGARERRVAGSLRDYRPD
jgi:hypothetical protein